MRLLFCYSCWFIVLVISFFPINAFGQLLKGSADTIVVTPTHDSIFIFNHSATGSLFAKNPTGETANFEWAKYDSTSASFGFKISMKTETNTTSSLLSGLTNGGYRVHIIAPGIDQTYTAWVFINNKLTVKIKEFELHADDGRKYVKYFSSTCEALDLSAVSKPEVYTFRNTSTNDKDSIQNRVKYTWWADPAIEIFNTDTTYWFRANKSRLPLDTTLFYVKGTDRYGAVSKNDSVWYPPILSKALFDMVDTFYTKDEKNSAPFSVSFRNKSKNTAKSTWYFGIPVNGKDSVIKHDTVLIKQIYYLPKTYKIRLITESPDECIDSTSKDLTIAPAQIGKESEWPDAPNVFTPNGDGTNDFFYIYNISIQQFRFSVYSRWGKRVYQHEGDGTEMLNNWKGWDGKINGFDASEGIYYYVLEVLAWDKDSQDKLKNKGNFRGFFYLFRQKTTP
jgi:gliding motility-associated-like protein